MSTRSLLAPVETVNRIEPEVSGVSWRRDRVFWVIFCLSALFGLLYNFVMLPGFGPDEPLHIAYVRLLLDQHRLPFMDAQKNYLGGAHPYHPPLYYLLQLPFFALGRALPGNAQAHLMRLVSLALCLAALPMTYQIALAASNRDRVVARLATALVALLPIFGMFGGVVNNDSATLLAATAFLWLLAVKFPLDTGLKSAVVLGVAFGLGALCKGSVLLCDGAALLAYLWTQNGRRALLTPRVWARLAIVAVLLIAIAGPWYWRNHVLYGQWQPVPVLTNPALPSRSAGLLVMMLHDNFPPLFAFANWGIFYSTWSQKDWIPELVRTPIYIALALFCAAAFVGIRRGRQRFAPSETNAALQEKIACRASYAAFGLTWVSCLFVALFVHWGQAEGGRYLVPAFSGFAIFLARGWRGLVGARALSRVLWAHVIAFCALNVLCLYWLLAYLNPTYGS